MKKKTKPLKRILTPRPKFLKNLTPRHWEVLRWLYRAKVTGWQAYPEEFEAYTKWARRFLESNKVRLEIQRMLHSLFKRGLTNLSKDSNAPLLTTRGEAVAAKRFGGTR